MKRNDDMVSASEIALWAWCSESRRPESLGEVPQNQAQLRRGEKFHAWSAFLERWSGRALALGWWLLAAALLLAALALVLVGVSGPVPRRCPRYGAPGAPPGRAIDAGASEAGPRAGRDPSP